MDKVAPLRLSNFVTLRTFDRVASPAFHPQSKKKVVRFKTKTGFEI